MDNLFKKLLKKKQRLDAYKPFPSELLKNLEEWYRVELTYTSNAIEGNTLTRQETALIVEEGITVQGKSVQEHLEAINHAKALDYIKTLKSKNRQALTSHDVLDI